MSVLLVVPPFHFLDRPALGVSLLKPAIERTGIRCDVLYLNLAFADAIGRDLYEQVTERRYQAMLGEWLFAADLFADDASDPERYVNDVLLGRFADRVFVDRALELRATEIPRFLDRVLVDVPWSDYAVVGATSTFQQNCPSLALLKRVKAQHPDVVTVMGGANCEGPMGAAIHELFPFVDYVCSGEGDRVFPDVVSGLARGELVAMPPGIYGRGQTSVLGDANRAPAITDMDSLPHADFDDYFTQLAASGVGAELNPILVFETARGCWWGEKHHCTFCGLNGADMQYRSKSPDRALGELDDLIARHDNRMIHVVDNILDLRYFESFLESLARRSFPPNFYYMTKANLTKDQLRLLARAGVRDVTPGIESLSTPVLRLMDKGVSGLQNVRLLKWCAEIGIVPNWAFLYGFPSEDPFEYREMAELVPSLTHLKPPGGFVQLRLDRFSPNFEQAESWGFVNIRPAEPYQHVYPFRSEQLSRLVWHFDFDYADGREPAVYTSQLRKAIDAWNEAYEVARLDLVDDGDRLEIHDARPAAVREKTLLDGPARAAYLALDAGATAQHVHAVLVDALGAKAPAQNEVTGWLDEWVQARLVMREGNRYLGLATNLAERIWLPAERIAALMRG